MPRSLFGGTSVVLDAPDFNWQSLERVSGLTFIEPQRAVLVETMHRYLRYLTTQRAMAHTKDVKHRCELIYKHVKTLVNLLMLHPKNKPSDNDEINLIQAVFSVFPINIYRDTYIRQLIQLRIGAKVALIRLREEGQPGRPSEEGLRDMIRRWHAIYIQAGGPDPGCTRSRGSSLAKGQLLDLIYDALQQVKAGLQWKVIREDIPSNRDALARLILDELKPYGPPYKPGQKNGKNSDYFSAGKDTI